jgi:hypothetical protein
MLAIDRARRRAIRTIPETNPQEDSQSVHQRISAVLDGKSPDRLPFADRLEIWFRHHRRAGTLPKTLRDSSLSEAHRALGLGEQVFVTPHSVQLNGVQVISTFNDESVVHADDPILNHFPDSYDLVPPGKIGVHTTRFVTPVGELQVEHEVLEFMVEMGIERPYLRRHPIQDETDYRTVEYILERAQPRLEIALVRAEEARVGNNGWVVPLLRRIPFQQLLLEYLGEEALFYALYDSPRQVERLLQVLDIHVTQTLHTLADVALPYVEFCDNLEGAMTNPKLYTRYCLPFHQRYTEILHTQGKKVGSHTDGNLKPLLPLLAESGLDVCESVTPAPTTACTLDEILRAWPTGPLIWGGIPSIVLDSRISDKDFVAYVDDLFQTIAGQPIILGIGDMVMPESSVERIRYIADRIEDHAVGLTT